jgi:hypothetical protein
MRFPTSEEAASCLKRYLVVTDRFTSPRNLFQALRVIDKTKPLWVDAICINQADISERNAQIRLMSNIYRSALCVLAYVGAESETDALAFDALTMFYDLIDKTILRDAVLSTGRGGSKTWAPLPVPFWRVSARVSKVSRGEPRGDPSPVT